MHARHYRRTKRQETAVPAGDGLGGAVTISGGGAGDLPPATDALILSTGAGPAAPVATNDLPTLAPGFTLTTGDPAPASTAAPEPSETAAQTQAMSNQSALSTSAVVAACVGSFIGLAIVICGFIWWTRHSSTKRGKGTPRTPMSENRNARGEVEQQKTRSGMWNKLHEDHGHGGGHGHPQEMMTEEEENEKNFSMFKKRTMSMRTTRTAKALEEHGFDMPPLTQYHPDLAQQLAQPERPFAQRQESGVSWDGETVGDDSFLSLRSVRVESGAMSPTFGIAKMTPPAVSSQLHKWESAEVLTLEEASMTRSEAAENPFADSPMERRKSASNPFFGAGDVHRTPSRRSRSNSRGQHSQHSRNASRSSRTRRSPSRSRVVSQGSQIDPFADLPGSHETARELPPFVPAFAHAHTESSASSGSDALTSERAMKSLIAALDLTQEEVEERLRVVSMQPSLDSRYSSVLAGGEDDVSSAYTGTAGPSSSRR